MSNATNMSVRRDDGTDVTLVPVSSGVENGAMVLVFRELSTTKPEMACIKLTLTVETLKSGVKKITRKLEVPVMAIIPAGSVNADGRTAAPAVDHVETDIRVRYHHPMSNASERADSLRMGNYIDSSGHVTAGNTMAPSAAAASTYRDVISAYQIVYGDVNFVWPSA